MDEERLEHFSEAVESLHAVVDLPVIVGVDAGDRQSCVRVRGKLRVVAHADRVIFAVGESGYLEFRESLFTGGSRSSVDGGDYWGITVTQGTINVHVTDDMHTVA